MRILIDIGHPAHVHLFKNMIWKLENDGHEVKITARDKDVALQLLDAYGFDYEFLGKHHKKLLNKLFGLITRDYKLYKIARKFKPDVLIGVGNYYIAQVSRLIGKPSILFSDDDSKADWLTGLLYKPFVDILITPYHFRGKINPKKHIRIKGYKELAYLHPNYFKPNPLVLENVGIDSNDVFILLRFVSWEAFHDRGYKGFDIKTKQKFVKELERYGKVFISSEAKLPLEFEKYKLNVPLHKIHDLLYYAHMFIGDSQTMTTEAAILGTPAIRCNSFADISNDLSDTNFVELENIYGLTYSIKDPLQALKKALELLADKNLKNKWQKKREKLLSEKIDVTKFMTEFIEDYPNSVKISKK